MSGTVVGEQAFTIEQIELMRRLRNSGITKEQIIKAFESFDRIDQELGNLYNIPVSHNQHASKSQHVTTVNSSAVTHGNNTVRRTVQNSTQSPTGDHSSNRAGHLTVPNPHSGGHRTVSSSQGQRVDIQNSRRIVQNNSGPGARSAMYLTKDPHGVKRQVIEINDDEIESNGSYDDDNSISTQKNSISNELDSEVEDFFRQGKEKSMDEIRNFVGKNNINIPQIATMTGRKNAEIDQFLRGSYRDVQDSTMHAVAMWYLTYKKMVQSTSNINVSTPAAFGSQVYPVQVVKAPEISELFTPRKRERFIFQMKHLEVLETSFNQNAYPSYEQREAIAHMCNMAVSNMGAIELMEREKVTPHMVLNWFANRRKEVKRIAREEGIPASEVVLPSKIQKMQGFDSSVDKDIDLQEAAMEMLESQINNSQKCDTQGPDSDKAVLVKNEPDG